MNRSRTTLRALRVATAIAVLAIWDAGPMDAAAQTDYSRIATIQIPGSPLASFGTSWVDQVRQQYLLTDRSNRSLAVISTDTNTFAFQVPGFSGVSTGTATAGPNGVTTVAHRYAWVGDGNSEIKVVDLKTRAIVDRISTGGTSRVNQLCHDPRDHLVMAANDFDTPPFVTFISTEGNHRILGRLTFPNATNQLQQGALQYCAWWAKTGLFYLTVPEAQGRVFTGEVAVIDPRTRTLANTFPVSNESSGLAIGPNGQAMVGGTGSSGIFIIDLTNGSTVASFPLFDTDQVWYDPGAGLYFSTSEPSPGPGFTPELVVFKANPPTQEQNLPVGVYDHSLAADSETNQLYVATSAVLSTVCSNGCISVYADSSSGGQQQAAGGQ